MGQQQRRSSIAGDDDEVRLLLTDDAAHHLENTLDQLGFTTAAVGEERIIRPVDEAGIRAQLDDLTKDREASEPGVKNDDGRRAARDTQNWYSAGVMPLARKYISAEAR